MDISSLVQLLIMLAIAGLIFYVLWWGASHVPDPFGTVLRVIAVIVAVVFLVNLLLPMMGSAPVIRFR
jgi:hypothetical protein